MRRAGAGALGMLLIIGLTAAPAWAATVPDAPTKPSVATGNAQITVTFNTPANNGDPITGYTATCDDGVTPVSAISSGAVATPIAVTGLTPGNIYTCTAFATNGIGNGPASAASDPVQVGVPSTMAAPTVTRGDGTLVVTFSAPANNGSGISGYDVNCPSTNSGTTGTGSFASSPITVSGMTNGKTYHCHITATNGVGTSIASPDSSPTIVVASAPDSPAQPTVTRGNGTLVVATSPPPASNGDPISSYTATCPSTDLGVTGSASAPSSPITVSGMTNGKHYMCHVTATNGVGTSAASADSTPTIVVAMKPDAPATPTITRGNGTLVVTFGAPANNGDPITSYTAACPSTNGGALGSASLASSPITVGGMTNGKTYACHVTATNLIGTSTVSGDSTPTVVVAGVPSAPIAPDLDGTGNGQIDVSVTPPANNGDAITSYAANCTSGNGGTPGSGSGASSTVTVTGLTNTKTYTCTATATNNIGTGPASPASGSAIVGIPDTPATPTVAGADSQITVTFAAPASNGNPITNYTAACTSNNGGPLGFASAASSPITVTGVANGKTYRCHVTATNAAGISSVSPDSGTIVPNPLPDFPDPPDQPTVAIANHAVQVTFVAPANDGGSPITGYTASCFSLDGGAPGSHSGATSPITVTGLTNSNTYVCHVVSTNMIGDSLASPDSDPVIPLGIPDAPPKPTVVRGNARIVVTFDTPADNGSPVFSFTAVCISSNGGATGSHNGFFSPITVTGLTNGKTYTCRASATNDNGVGQLSVASLAVIPRAPPSKPTILSVLAGPAPGATGPLTIAIQAPANNGSPITSYKVTCKRTGTGALTVKTAASTTIQVTGLVTGQAYTCTAIAINAGGNSLASAAVGAKVGTPGRPTIARVTQQGGKLTVSFLTPAANGKPITKFTIRCSSTNGGINRGIAGFNSPLTVKNLSVAGTYTCLLTATNARGDGAPTKIGPLTIS